MKGQMNAAILVAVLAALIVVYIIFLPSEERLELIGENRSDKDSFIYDKEEILLEDEEIVMEVIDEDKIERDLPSVNLFTSKSSDTIRQENTIYIRNGLFDKQDKQLVFKLQDPDNTDDVLISFFSKKSKGNLIMIMNGYEIYNSEISQVNVKPIRVSKDYLATTNTLEIAASGVGVAFWSTNEFLLENFKITADVTDISTRESVLRFVIPREEAQNIEKAELRFVPECQPADVGVLDILINNRMIFSSVPDCGVPRPLEFAPANIITGENTISFRTDKGRYLIDQIRVTSELEETPSFTFFFTLSGENFAEIEDGDKLVNLTFFFTDDEEDKEAEIIVNSGKTFMRRHDDFEWSTILNTFVEVGSNSLKIVPEERLEIRKLLVTLEDS